MRHAAYTITTEIGLDPAALAAGHALLARCNRHDATELLLTLKGADAAAENTPLYLLARSEGVIVGMLELVGYHEIEGTLLVTPERRREGIGGALVAAATTQLAARGIASWLLTSDEAFAGGAAFARRHGGVLAHNEHRLTLDPARVPSLLPQPGLVLRPATTADRDDLAAITAAAFGDQLTEVMKWVAQDESRVDRRWFVVTLGARPIGSLRVVQSSDGLDITAFGVIPAQQGRGYGRALLAHTIATLLAEGERRINIEVATDNAAALGLYLSCGFVARHTYGYYRLDTTPS
jgi:ribosomal protein S18 acetylase RimI-like enzyme